MKKLFTRAIALILLVVLCGCGKPAVSEKVETVDTPDAIVSKTINTSSVKNEMTSSRVTSSTVSKAESNVTSKTPNQSVTSSALSSTVSTQQPKENDVVIYYEYPIVENSFAMEPSSSIVSEIEEDPTETETDGDEDIKETSSAIETENQVSEPTIIPEYTSYDFMSAGVIYWGNWRWTWYSERVLPGGGLAIPGRHTDANGYVCDENDYICLAATSLSKGTIVDTPFGKQGKVYDSGCAYGTLDVYVNW